MSPTSCVVEAFLNFDGCLAPQSMSGSLEGRSFWHQMLDQMPRPLCSTRSSSPCWLAVKGGVLMLSGRATTSGIAALPPEVVLWRFSRS